MPANMSVRESHDIALQLQHRVRVALHPSLSSSSWLGKVLALKGCTHASHYAYTMLGPMAISFGFISALDPFSYGCVRWKALTKLRELLSTSTMRGEMSQNTRQIPSAVLLFWKIDRLSVCRWP